MPLSIGRQARVLDRGTDRSSEISGLKRRDRSLKTFHFCCGAIELGEVPASATRLRAGAPLLAA